MGIGGCLVNQFLAPRTNKRTEFFGVAHRPTAARSRSRSCSAPVLSSTPIASLVTGCHGQLRRGL
ncbi:hypothetical protein [Mycobacterium leprae]|uniref:hypothetical protein n=1 Tax=Mycobacterium leprae TaxID=1769 RepID=UPI0003110824